MHYMKYFKFLSSSKKKRKKILQFLAQNAAKSVGKQKKGKPRANLETMMAGILYYLRSGCSWELLPIEFGPHQTVYGWYVRLCDEKFFNKLFIELKKAFFKKNNKKIKRLCSDGSLVQQCKKNELTGHNPRNKNKSTLNRMMTTNEDGLPLCLLITSGVAHDSIFFTTCFYEATEGLELDKNWYSHADKGFDSKQIRTFIRNHGGIPVIPHRQLGNYQGISEKKDPHRFVVERTFSWANAYKNLKTVFIKRSDRIKEMSSLFSLIIYLKRFSFLDISSFMIDNL